MSFQKYKSTVHKRFKCANSCTNMQLCNYLRKCVHAQLRKYASAQVLAQVRKGTTTCVSVCVRKCTSTQVCKYFFKCVSVLKSTCSRSEKVHKYMHMCLNANVLAQVCKYASAQVHVHAQVYAQVRECASA